MSLDIMNLDELYEFNSNRIKELDNRIAIIKAGIYDIFFTSNDPKTISFTVILNRILILIQKPITFVIYKKNEKGNYDRYFNFVKDGWHKNDFLSELKKFEEDDYYSNYLFPTYSKKYKLAVFKVDRNEHKNENEENRKSKFKYVKNKSTKLDLKYYLSLDKDKDKDKDKNYIRYMMLSIFEGKYSNYFVDTAEKSIDSISQDFYGNKIESYNKKEFYKNDYFNLENFYAEKLKFRKSIDESINKAFLKVKESTKIINSLCLENSQYNESYESLDLANILFFVRDYSDLDFSKDLISLKKRRVEIHKKFDGYDYTIRVCIPDSQREEIQKYFSESFESKFNNDEIIKFYKKRDRNIKNVLDKWFWSEFYKDKTPNKENFTKNIIDILSSDLGKYARSFTDPCFQNGLVHFRLPFENGGFDRAGIFKEELDITEMEQIHPERLDDAKRIVISYYLFQGMRKISKEEELSIVMIPIELNGRIFGVTTHILVNKYYADSKVIHSGDSWQSMYYLYSGIGNRIERNVRKSLKASFSKIVSENFFNFFKITTETAFRTYQSQIDYDEIINYGNNISFILSLFIPYGYVVFGGNEDGDSIPVFLNSKFLNFSKIKDNEFYPKYRNDIIGSIDSDDFRNYLLNDSKNFDLCLEVYMNELKKSLVQLDKFL
jgi:hypothetical protein